MSRSAGFSPTLWARLVQSPAPVVVVTYGDDQDLQDNIREVCALLDVEVESASVEDLDRAVAQPDRALLFLVPFHAQEETMAQLAVERDQLGRRTKPLVMFLPRDGAGLSMLSGLPFLASWLRGRILDPELDLIDVETARSAFQHVTGRSPEAYLVAWRQGELRDDLDHNLWHGEARLLSREEGQ